MTSDPECGISFMGLLAIVLITLKLTGYIAWPWLWVLAPLWGPVAVCVVVLVCVVGLDLLVNQLPGGKGR